MRSVLAIARRTLPALALVGAFIGAVPAAGSAPAPLLQAGGVFQKIDPHQVLPTHNADTSSLNWSGYAAIAGAGQQITDVTQHWIVPTVSTAPAGFSSTWAGIGGYNSQDLIQAGTESDTAQTPYAWYEILPASETPITSGCVGDNTCTVRAGDAMSVTIHSTGGSGWNISMTNPRWTWSLNLNYASTFSSAEWILEAPTVGAQTVLANVGTQKFTGVNTFTVNGVTKNIRGGNSVRILLSPGLLNEATPSALNSTGDHFNDCAYKQSCATPA
jgi:peptidase A4-like protein